MNLEERNQLIISKYLDNVKISDITKEFKISDTTVAKVLKNNNIPKRRDLLKVSEAIENEIIVLYENYTVEEISKIKNLHYSTVFNVLQRNNIAPNIEHRYTYKINHNFFELVDTEEKAYFLGLLYADGNICSVNNTVRITLQIGDLNIIEEFQNCVGKEIPIKTYKHTYGYYLVFAFSSEKMKKDLINLGCTPAKSFTLKFPTEAQVPKELQRHFIRGYFDGDGSVFIRKNNYISSSFIGTIEFLSGLQSILHKECGFKITNMQDAWKNGNNTRFIAISSYKKCNTLFEYMYLDSSVYLQRKYDKFIKGLNNYAKNENT